MPAKPSTLLEAELAATMVDPKEFTADWIRVLDMEKSKPCNPAGTPTLRMILSFRLSIQSRPGMKRMARLLLYKHLIISSAERYCEMTVDHATPATLISRTATKTG